MFTVRRVLNANSRYLQPRMAAGTNPVASMGFSSDSAGEKPLVTITGVTGFLGAETAKQFLQDGSFRVRGTVRSLSDEQKLDVTRRTCGDLFDQMELVEAELLNKDSMIEAIDGSTYVAHIAQPLSFVAPEEELMQPAVDGTLAAMEGCKATGAKRCVVTSSVAAVKQPAVRPADNRFDASIWSDESKQKGFMRVKTMGELTAWRYLESLPEEERFELVSINPTTIWGPFHHSKLFASAQLMVPHITGKRKKLPKTYMGAVDVRDCALAHVRALQVPEAAGKRFLMFGGPYTTLEINQILFKEFSSQGWPVVLTESNGEYKDPDTFDCGPVKDILGIEFTPIEKTCIDTVNSMIANGCITKPK